MSWVVLLLIAQPPAAHVESHIQPVTKEVVAVETVVVAVVARTEHPEIVAHIMVVMVFTSEVVVVLSVYHDVESVTVSEQVAAVVVVEHPLDIDDVVVSVVD